MDAESPPPFLLSEESMGGLGSRAKVIKLMLDSICFSDQYVLYDCVCYSRNIRFITKIIMQICLQEIPKTEHLEHQWIKEFQQGNAEAFSNILKRYKKPVIYFAYHFLGNQNDAEDAAQEILMKVYRALPAFTPTGKLSTWIFTIASHHCQNLNRKKKLLSILSLDALISTKKEDEISSSFTQKIDPEKNSELHIMQSEIHHALLKLPGNQRTAIILSKFENRSLEEIAAVLNVSPGSVKQLIFRAKLKLRNYLKKYI